MIEGDVWEGGGVMEQGVGGVVNLLGWTLYALLRVSELTSERPKYFTFPSFTNSAIAPTVSSIGTVLSALTSVPEHSKHDHKNGAVSERATSSSGRAWGIFPGVHGDITCACRTSQSDRCQVFSNYLDRQI